MEDLKDPQHLALVDLKLETLKDHKQEIFLSDLKQVAKVDRHLSDLNQVVQLEDLKDHQHLLLADLKLETLKDH